MTRARSNAELPHEWTTGRYESGKTSNGTMFYDGATIYSYGYHYPIARYATVPNIPNASNSDVPRTITVCLFNSTSSTKTTEGKHKNGVRRAIPSSWYTFDVPNVVSKLVKQLRNGTLSRDEHVANWRYLRDERNRFIELASRAKALKGHLIHCAEDKRNEANQYAQIFKLSRRRCPVIEASPDLENELVALRAEADERERKEKAKRVKLERERLEQWIVGTYHGTLPNSDVHFRLITKRLEDGSIRTSDGLCQDDEIVQTSLGATFPLRDAIPVLNMLRLLWKHKRNWKRNGEQIELGNYRLDSVTWNDDGSDATIIAGCHTVLFSRVVEFARAIGL